MPPEFLLRQRLKIRAALKKIDPLQIPVNVCVRGSKRSRVAGPFLTRIYSAMKLKNTVQQRQRRRMKEWNPLHIYGQRTRDIAKINPLE